MGLKKGLHISKCTLVGRDYEVDVLIDGRKVQVLASIGGEFMQWHIMYGKGAEIVKAKYGDDVEQEIEDEVIKTLRKLR